MHGRRAALILTGFAAVACTSGNPNANPKAGAQFRELIPGVKIVYSANLNGEIEPCGCRSNPTGGLHRRWNLTEQKLAGEKIVVDSGDLFYRSAPVPPFLERQWNYQAEVLVRAFNAFGVDAVAPGELDFAAGLAQFEKLVAQASFPVICANIHRKGEKKPLLRPYLLLNKGGRKVALFAVYDEALSLPPELEASDHIVAARAMVDQLRGKADVLLALTHLGLEKDQELARQVTGIDAIFGAHTQSFLPDPEKIGDTLVFQTSFRGQHLGVYEKGENGQYQIDSRFDSPADRPNPMDKLLAEAKTEIGRINKETESELLAESSVRPAKHAGFQTFPRCAECHAPQHAFHQKTAHFRAYETLVKARQGANLDCLKCHTAGMQQPGGWKQVDKLVLNAAGKPVEAESFAKSLPQSTVKSLAKVSKAFINVQCESCHGAAGDHPFSASYPKAVSTTTCLQCHTPERAPGWYKDGKPDPALLQAKLKSVTCPATKN